MPRLEDVSRVLILGSGAIKIGEAGEFDYSGAQCVKALQEEGVQVVLVNPNIATIQTDPQFVDKAYFLPVTPEYVEEVIEEERPDSILLGFGGQTALNCGVELWERGILSKYGVRVLGTGIRAIELADDRELFRDTMLRSGVPIPESRKANTVDEALEAAKEVGYPIMVRVAYTLGGQGSGVAEDPEELAEIVSRALVHSRINQVLIEEYLGGWKEVEYEVVRDSADNCVIVCNMENLDPMGIHTGDSIVVAPSQTLNNNEYHLLRQMSLRVVRALNIIGECNIQFAMDPQSDDFRVIEVNSRLSRSSALASKATGYPIAYIAAKLALGYTLTELENKVTGVTTACFEPALDYVVVKMPRWDFQKFRMVNRRIGTQMKSVGEVMAIGRGFPEALQKAVRMLNTGRELTDMKNDVPIEQLKHSLEEPTDQRLFQIAKALHLDIDVEEINRLTNIDPWFLYHIKEIVDFHRTLQGSKLDCDTLMKAKALGFSDGMIGAVTGLGEMSVRALRRDMGVTPVVKQIDTMAAEWPAQTNYLYMTYNGDEDDVEFTHRDKIIVLGSGCYHIGASVEFDWSCVNMAWALKSRGIEEVTMINCNPETVSTDFDVMDKLYFEELTLERVLDIVEKESPRGVVVSVGGQIPNNLAKPLSSNGVKILGTPVESIHRAEDRSQFSSLLDSIDIKQPQWSTVESIDQATEFAKEVGYPVIIRPSYVLSGAAMNVVLDEAHMRSLLEKAVDVSGEHPVVVSKFLSNAKEVEVDAVSDGDNVFIGSIIEHVEEAGIHSGDATMSIPSLTISEGIKERIRETTRRIARELCISGPFNIQYMVKNGDLSIIECNLRSSRSMPYVSKAIGVNLMDLAAIALMGDKVPDGEGITPQYCVKAPQFSFMRLEGADPLTGVEMVSTGEVACFGDSFEEALLKALIASGMKIPRIGDAILISAGEEKDQAVEIACKLSEKGYRIFATKQTGEAIREEGIECLIIDKSRHRDLDVLDLLTRRELDFVINSPEPDQANSGNITDSYLIRRKAIEFGIPVITNLELAAQIAEAL